MSKVHLSAKVPNEGARRLVQWMVRKRMPLAQMAERIGVSAEMLVRMIEDGLVPAAGTIERIAGQTGGFVRGWTRCARGWWFEAPLAASNKDRTRATGFSPVSVACAGGAASCAPQATLVAPPGAAG